MPTGAYCHKDKEYSPCMDCMREAFDEIDEKVAAAKKTAKEEAYDEVFAIFMDAHDKVLANEHGMDKECERSRRDGVLFAYQNVMDFCKNDEEWRRQKAREARTANDLRTKDMET